MSAAQKKVITEAEDGLRLDRWFKRQFPKLPHARLAKLIRTGQIRLDGARVKAGARLEAGQTVRIPPNLQSELGDGKTRTPISSVDAAFVRELVIHRDPEVIVLNKPAGLAVQGGTKTHRHLDSMLDALRFDLNERPKLVHRLDRDTSGVLVLARTAKAAAHLANSFKSKDATKIYWALCEGTPRPAKGMIDLPLAKKRVAGAASPEKMMPQTAGAAEHRPAITYYAVVARAAQKAAWLALLPLTGRTHQLRAHCSAIGHPIIGDFKYGDSGSGTRLAQFGEGLHLHARSLDISHPKRGRLHVTAPLPDHMTRTWEFFEFDQNHDGDPFAELIADLR